MNDSQASDSSLDGDDSTVSSKSRRQDVNGDGDAGESSHQVADFSDMPSLASYRGDEVSLASTLWTDCDQSLPSLSSYRTKDMSVASGSRRNNRHDSSRRSSGDDESDGSGTERTRGNISTSGRKQAPIESIEEQTSKPQASDSPPQEEVDTSGALSLGRGGDSMPRLPTRRAMDDSVRSGSIKSDSESDAESDMTDESPDVSIDTDEENEDDEEEEENDNEVEPAHGPSHIFVTKEGGLSPKSPKSQAKVNGVLPDVPNPPLGVEDESGETSEKEKSDTVDEAMSPTGEPEPPAIIATPPPSSSKSAKTKSPKKSPKKSTRKKKDKEKDGTSSLAQSDLPSPGIVDEKPMKRWRKKRTNQDTSESKSTPSRSASGNDRMRFFGKKNQSDRSLGVRRANSEIASVLDSIKPPEEEKKRGILKRFSSSLKQMARPGKTFSGPLGNMTKIPSTGGKSRSKLKKLSANK